MGKILDIMKRLNPNLALQHDDSVLITFITIAQAIVNNEEIEPDKLELATALLTLHYIDMPTVSNISSKTIGNVSISYSNDNGKDKWMKLYESLINGIDVNELTLYYVGI